MTIEITSHRLPPSKCTNPSCAAPLDSAGGLHDKMPAPGDRTICIKCSEMMIFGDDLMLRSATEEERATMLEDKEVLEYLRALLRLHN